MSFIKSNLNQLPCPIVSTYTLPGGLNDDLVKPLYDDSISIELCDRRLIEEGSEFVKSMLRWINEGLNVSSVHMLGVDLSDPDKQRRTAAINSAKRQIELTDEFGAGLIVVHASMSVLPSERNERKLICKQSLAEIADACEQKNIQMAVETMPETKHGTSRAYLGFPSKEVLELISECPAKTAGICLDVNHVNLKEELPEVIDSLGNRILEVHIADNDGIRERHMMPFVGVIDWKSVFNSLGRINFRGNLVYEVAPPT